jgi:cytochrome b561
MQQVSRYHPLLVTLHWVLAVLIIALCYIAAVLAGFFVLHVLAALYHQFVMKDGLFRRMFFGRRVQNLSIPTE